MSLRLRFPLLAALICAAAPAPAPAKPLNLDEPSLLRIGQYHDHCSGKVVTNVSYCTGYARMALDWAIILNRACLPPGVSDAQVKAAIDAHARGRLLRPASDDAKTAAMVLQTIFARTWPCPR